VPRDLHFPSVAKRLEWHTLPIVDWIDIEPRSREYDFLKEIGVREVPDLHKLIDRIVHEHNHQSKLRSEYKVPLALRFFVENFQRHYSKSWKNANIKASFLPSLTVDTNDVTQVVLSTPDTVFKGCLSIIYHRHGHDLIFVLLH
jgi:hypothetical protein